LIVIDFVQMNQRKCQASAPTWGKYHQTGAGKQGKQRTK
jgi:hypothetical protein